MKKGGIAQRLERQAREGTNVTMAAVQWAIHFAVINWLTVTQQLPQLPRFCVFVFLLVFVVVCFCMANRRYERVDAVCNIRQNRLPRHMLD